MGLVDVNDAILQGITNIAYKENVPVESLIGTVIQNYIQCCENKKTIQQCLQGKGKRKYKRQKTDWEDSFHFQFTDGLSNEKIPGKLKDISLDGLSFSFSDQCCDCAQEDFSFCSQTLTVSFRCPEDKRTIRFCMTPMHIRREGDETIVGLAFTDDCDYYDSVSFLRLLEQQANIGKPPSTAL